MHSIPGAGLIPIYIYLEKILYFLPAFHRSDPEPEYPYRLFNMKKMEGSLITNEEVSYNTKKLWQLIKRTDDTQIIF
jgi:hypothetical protein